MSLSTAAREIRCPAPHPKMAGTCGRLLARYEPGLVGRLELACVRCDTATVLSIGSTLSTSSTSSMQCGPGHVTVTP